jgi:Na+-transporting methylmalonyl-CoA/oxaloacetate decarboxylase gamma subunit
MLIPIVLSIAVLIIAPKTIHQEGLSKGLFLTFVGMGFPWLLYFIISRAVEKTISEEVERRKEDEDKDFI